jgi:DNA-binding response OmpR family regulator
VCLPERKHSTSRGAILPRLTAALLAPTYTPAQVPLGVVGGMTGYHRSACGQATCVGQAEGTKETVRVLLVEDEERLADTIARGLRREGMAVDVVLDGRSALTKAAVNSYDVVVLDRNLPVIHGDDVCRELVSRHSLARILMLTAAGSIHDRVAGLDLGADDYLPKPFALKELIARIRALSRRTAVPVAPVLSVGDLSLDPARHVAERAGRELGLTKKEFGVLEVLLSAEGRVVSAEELLEKVWDENADPFTNVVRVTIMTLRRKIGDPPLIETVAGVGYKV